MKRLVSPTTLLFVFVVLSGPFSVEPTRAQEPSGAAGGKAILRDVPADSLSENAANLVSAIRAKLGAAEQLFGKLQTANAEDSLVLRLQLNAMLERSFSDLHSLADLVVSLEEQKGSQEALRYKVEALYRFSTPRIWRHIHNLRREIDDSRGLRASVKGTERLALEDRITTLTRRLDRIYRLGRTQLQKMERLGLDVSGPRAEFVELLRDRATEVSGRIDLALSRIDELTARVQDAPEDADLRVNLVAAHKSLDTNTASLSSLLDIMSEEQLPTRDYRAQLVTATRDFTTGLLDRDVAKGLLDRGVTAVRDWLFKNGPSLILKLMLIFVILLMSRLLARFVQSGVGRALDSSKLNISTLLRRTIVTSAYNAVMLLGFLIALSQMNVSLGPLLAGLGVAGFIAGFALQDTLANFAAGLMILIYRPYDVGDMVDVGGVFGKVDRMSLVSTTMLTIDNQTIVVPNNKIWGDVIKNVTAQSIRRVDMVFGVSYSDDIPKAERILEEILKQHSKVLTDPAPVVKLHKLGESSVDFVVRPWVAAADYWDVYWDVTRAVKMRFDEEGVSIPFPQRDVHIYEERIKGT